MPARARIGRPSSDRILTAAERVFARKGYGETSLRQLMASARVSTTAFYARFDSKEAVLVALIDRLIDDLQRAVLPPLVAARNPKQGAAEAIAALVATFRGHRRLVAIALTEGISSGPARAALARAYRSLVDLLAARLPVKEGDREALAWAFIGALLIQIQRWAVFDEIDEARLEAELRAVAARLLPAPRPSRKR